MKHTDIVALVAYVSQLVPAQKIDEYTADAWADVLGPVQADMDMARRAVARIASRQTWVSPADIKGELHSMLPARAHGAPAEARALPSRWEPRTDEQAERARRGAAKVRAEIERHRKESEPEVDPDVSETLLRAREVARQYKRDRDRQPERPPRPLAGAVGKDPGALVAKFKDVPEKVGADDA